MKKIIEGRWNCSFCGTKEIPGGKRQCPNCGRVRDKDFEPYVPTGKKADYVPEDVAKKINRNPDWMCGFCGNYCSDSNTTCPTCGAPRSEDNLNYFDIKEKKKAKNKSTSNFYSKKEEENTFTKNTYSLSSSKQNFLNIFKKPAFTISLVAICIFLFISGFIYLLIPKEVNLNITELSWSRSIDIQRLQCVQENGWELPPGAELKYTIQEIHHTESVLDYIDTYTTLNDLGNGYFEEETHERPVYKDVPIYKTKYYYYIDKWLYERSVKTDGIDKSPYWGNVSLNYDERVSGKNSTYKVTGTVVDGKTKTFSISYEEWITLNVGQNVTLKASLGYATLSK